MAEPKVKLSVSKNILKVEACSLQGATQNNTPGGNSMTCPLVYLGNQSKFPFQIFFGKPTFHGIRCAQTLPTRVGSRSDL